MLGAATMLRASETLIDQREARRQMAAPCRWVVESLPMQRNVQRRREHYHAFTLELRKAGIPAEVSFRRSNPGNQMKRADALGARFALVLGDAELKSGRGKLKELKTGAEHEVDLAALPAALRRLAP